MARLNVSGTKFDFDMGNLSESPCRRCPNRPLLPACAANCAVLKRVQALLACSVSSVVNVSPEEDFTVWVGK
ncbi:MAG: hypothetical protein JEZ11_17540 [Desulfobacterales bacterium]|nr:hypothetical protein [Desulfobacterales bacterium]